MKKWFYIKIACLLPLFVFGEQTILTDAGREVLLRDDGSWEYLSDDRFGTLSDGSRVRLKPDGSWDIEQDETRFITIPAEALKRSEDTVKTDKLYLEIFGITIESQRGKNRKNSTLRTQMLVDIKIETSRFDLSGLNKGLIKVSDSRGRLYETKQITLQENISDTEKVVRITLDGAPRWWGIKFFLVEFEKGFLGHDRKIRLKKSVADVTRLEVDTLSTQ